MESTFPDLVNVVKQKLAEWHQITSHIGHKAFTAKVIEPVIPGFQSSKHDQKYGGGEGGTDGL